MDCQRITEWEQGLQQLTNCDCSLEMGLPWANGVSAAALQARCLITERYKGYHLGVRVVEYSVNIFFTLFPMMRLQ